MGRTQKKQIVIRMTEDDFAKLKKKIEQSGLCQAEYLRQAVLNKQIVSTEGISELVKELKRIGINLRTRTNRLKSPKQSVRMGNFHHSFRM